jgi:hypothetical protein
MTVIVIHQLELYFQGGLFIDARIRNAHALAQRKRYRGKR